MYQQQPYAPAQYYSIDVECVATGTDHNSRAVGQIALVDQYEQVRPLDVLRYIFHTLQSLHACWQHTSAVPHIAAAAAVGGLHYVHASLRVPCRSSWTCW